MIGMKILITGGNGQLGTELSAVLEAESQLDGEALIRECVEHTEITRIAP